MASKIRYTKNTLDRLETLLAEAGYTVRYEKGNFQSGACILEHKKLVIINRFFETEGRIIAFMDIIPQLAISDDQISEASKELLEAMLLAAEKEELV
jgi:hypothetical protein